MSNSYSLDIDQGTTYRANFFWKELDRSPVNLVGYIAKLQIRSSYTSETVLIDLTSEEETSDGDIIIFPNEGKVSIHIKPESTRSASWSNAVFDLLLISPSGDIEKVVGGKVKISKTSTRIN